MKPRFVLSPEAADDLVAIWRYIRHQGSIEVADRVESVIRERMVFLARNPGAGHSRKDLTDLLVRFFPVYSYLIVYRPKTKPLQIVAILMTRFVEVAGIEDEVVAFAVAVGFGDAEAKAGGDEEEDEFGEFAATLGVAFPAERMDWRDSSWARRWRAPARRPVPGHAGKRKRRKPWGLRL